MSDETFKTADEAIEAAATRLLDDCEVWARDAGADEAQIVQLREWFALLLRDGRATAVAMLECHARVAS
jgi:hypothetical protein